MNDFIFHNPAKVYFGKNQLEHLPEELAAFGTKVLMVYGGGSIKKSGLYDKVRGLLESAGMELFELAGVEPNPRHTTANRGAAICRQNGIDVVLAVGGGSAIDCAKGVAAAAKTRTATYGLSRAAWATDARPWRSCYQRCNRFRDGCLERHLEHGRQPEDRPGRKR
ncbi:MAG: iron-containing alcohol dehydrogenase [Eggerthella lenta]